MKLLKEKRGENGIQLIYKPEWSDGFELREVKRMNQLALPMLLPISYHMTPIGGRLQYSVYGMSSLTELQWQISNFQVLVELALHLYDALLQLWRTDQQFLERLDYFPQHVFYNMKTGESGFIYYPVRERSMQSDAQELFYGLALCYPCREDERQYWSDYLRYIQNNGVKLERFGHFLKQLMGEMNGKQLGKTEEMQTKPPQSPPSRRTVVLERKHGTSSENQTIPLMAPMLLHQSRQQKIMLERLPFSIGRVQHYCDYVLSDATVSKKHAVLLRQEDGTLVIQDNASLNGTWVNDRRLKKDEVYPLKNGDYIQIGCERFLYNA